MKQHPNKENYTEKRHETTPNKENYTEQHAPQ